MKYKYKISKVKGEEYLQIWKDDKLFKHIGSAKKLVKTLFMKETF